VKPSLAANHENSVRVRSVLANYGSTEVSNMNDEKKDFDQEAATWDEEPRRVKLVQDIADAISRAVVLTPDMDVMDFGCGTGLLTLRLQPLVHSITGVDSSQGMLDVLKAKIEQRHLSNVRPQLIDIEQRNALTGRYHLIATSMTFHHVRDIKPLLQQFHAVLDPAGYLCIADLDLEGGRFHSSNEGVFHFGFDRAMLRQSLLEAGFDDVMDTTAAEMVKPGPDGTNERFTVFLILGRKKAA
jgi:2-polyprenyl-3-methyl-5-hydroxy-6-metoxy-1,4-benzoquinol methylase